MTRLAYSSIDFISSYPQAVVEDVIKFSASDLLCYRAESPQELVKRQREMWDPVLDWCENTLSARFDLAEGIVHIDQPREAVTAFGIHVNAINEPIILGALHTITTLTGSAILALAVHHGEVEPVKAWEICHVDEDWQISQWGEDEEAQARRNKRWNEMRAADALMKAISA